MADKHHAQIKKHLASAHAAHKQVGDSLAKIEQVLSAMQGQQAPQQPAQAPGLPLQGPSPLGGQAG